MSAEAALKFIDVIMQHFPPFKWDEVQEKAWAATMVRELGSFSGNVINKAAETMVRSRKERRTPLVAECIDACLEARKWIESEDRAAMLTADRAIANVTHLDWTADRLKLATDLMYGPMGIQAAKEGWIGALHSFARKNSRLPQPGKELDAVKRDAKEFDEAYAKTIRGAAGPASDVLQKLGAEMLRKRNELADRVLKGAR